jgi:hypothetical protein
MPLEGPPKPAEFEVVSVPIKALPPLTLGRILNEEALHPWERRSGLEDPGSQQRFLYNEWSIDLCWAAGETRLHTASDLGLEIRPLPERFADASLCVNVDPVLGRLVVIPCWEVFRYYYAGSPLAAQWIFEFPRWKEETLERLLGRFDGHVFRRNISGLYEGPKETAARELRAIGLDAAASYVRSGRVQIWATPPFIGPATLEVIGLPLVVQGSETVFVQEIINSRPRKDAEPGTRWWPEPVPPRFRSQAESVAWWAMYRHEDLRGALRPELPSWEAFVELNERSPERLEVLRRFSPEKLRDHLLQAIARGMRFKRQKGEAPRTLGRAG